MPNALILTFSYQQLPVILSCSCGRRMLRPPPTHKAGQVRLPPLEFTTPEADDQRWCIPERMHIQIKASFPNIFLGVHPCDD